MSERFRMTLFVIILFNCNSHYFKNRPHFNREKVYVTHTQSITNYYVEKRFQQRERQKRKCSMKKRKYTSKSEVMEMTQVDPIKWNATRITTFCHFKMGCIAHWMRPVRVISSIFFNCEPSISRATMLSFKMRFVKRFNFRLLVLGNFFHSLVLLHLNECLTLSWKLKAKRWKKHLLNISTTNCLTKVMSANSMYHSIPKYWRWNIYFQFCDCFRLWIQSTKMITNVCHIIYLLFTEKCANRCWLCVKETFAHEVKIAIEIYIWFKIVIFRDNIYSSCETGIFKSLDDSMHLPRNSTRPMRFAFGFGNRNSTIRTVNDILMVCTTNSATC